MKHSIVKHLMVVFCGVFCAIGFVAFCGDGQASAFYVGQRLDYEFEAWRSHLYYDWYTIDSSAGHHTYFQGYLATKPGSPVENFEEVILAEGTGVKSGQWKRWTWECLDTGKRAPRSNMNPDHFEATVTRIEGGWAYIYVVWVYHDSGGGYTGYQNVAGTIKVRQTFDAYFRSTSTIEATNSAGATATVTSGRDQEARTSINANQGDNDTGRIDLKYQHNLIRRDDNGQGSNATAHWRGCAKLGSGVACDNRVGYAADFRTLAPLAESGPIAKRDDSETVELGQTKSVCTILSHSRRVTMNYDGSVSDYHDNEKTQSKACVDISHPYNFSLKVDNKFNDDIVFTGESPEIEYNIYNDKEDKPNPDIAHTASPTNTKTKVVSFLTNNLDESKLAGTGVKDSYESENGDICQYFRNKAGFSINSCNDQVEEEIGSVSEAGKLGTPKIKINDIDVTNTTNNKICVATAVSPSEGNGVNVDTNKWRISNASCRTIAKKPSVALKAGNVYSAGDIKTSVSNKTFGTFGSWGDHLAMARGQITHLGSGASLAQGNPGSSSVCTDLYSPLSVANSQCSSRPTLAIPGSASPTENGEFLSRIMNIYKDNKERILDQDINSINIDNEYVEKHGNRIIIYPEDGKDVTIHGNITINTTDMSGLRDIPQVVIIGKNINIDPGVERIDAWLITYGTKDNATGTYSGGEINTCNNGKDPNKGEISTAECSRELNINGPVLAKNIKFNRTAGAGAGDDSKTPAETVTLTPAAYLWGYSEAAGEEAAQAHTVYSREGAPRL